MPGARRPFLFSQDAYRCIKKYNCTKAQLGAHTGVQSGEGHSYLEVCGGWQHNVHPCITGRSVAEPDALLVNIAERETTKMHHCRSSGQASVMPDGGKHLCSTNQTGLHGA